MKGEAGLWGLRHGDAGMCSSRQVYQYLDMFKQLGQGCAMFGYVAKCCDRCGSAETG
jgi:hypothetical protein